MCGNPDRSRGFIMNGKTFTRGLLPWMAALMVKVPNDSEQYFCGGNLISRKHVLTGSFSKKISRNYYYSYDFLLKLLTA